MTLRFSRRLCLLTGIAGLLGFFLPKIFFDKTNISYLTGFMSFYSAGIFPTITLMTGHFSSLDVLKTSPLELKNEAKMVKEALYNLFLVLIASALFVLFVFLHSCLNVDCPLLGRFLRSLATSALVVGSYGSFIWLPRLILRLFDTKFMNKHSVIISMLQKKK